MFTKPVVSQSMIDAVNAVLNEDKKRMLTDAEMDETGFHKAAHAARKANQTHFEFQGKKYPVTAQTHAEGWDDMLKDVKSKASPQPRGDSGFKLGTRYGGGNQKPDTPEKDDEKLRHKSQISRMDKATKNEESHDDEKEDKKLIKKMVDKSCLKKEDMSFAERLVARLYENKATGTEEIFTDNNLGEEEMSDKQKAKREKIVMSMKDKSAGFKQRYGKNWKNVMYATATKQAMKEDSSDSYDEELDEGLKDMAKKAGHKILKTLGHGSDADMIKDLAKKTGVKDVNVKPMKKESVDATDYNPKSQGGTRKELLSKYSKSGDPKHAEAARKAGATQSELKSARGLDSMFGHRAGADKLGIKKEEVKDEYARKVEKYLKKKYNKEEVELEEANITHAAHFDDPKTGKWASMALLTAKDDEHAMDQAKDLLRTQAYGNYKLSAVEKHEPIKMKMKEDVTTDMLSGRETGGHSNGLKSFKVRLQDQIKAPEEEKPSTTKARSSIATHDNENVTAKIDKPFEDSFAESTEKDKPPFDGPYTKAKGNIKDKSGAIHTPMSRAKDLAKTAMKKIKSETMMGKISN